MRPLYILYSLLLLFLLSLSSPANFKNLNAINLLLPSIHSHLIFTGTSPQIPRVSYNLVAQFGSCYEWSSTNPESLQVTGKENSRAECSVGEKKYLKDDLCFSEAVVAVNSLQPSKKVIWITAKEKKTGEITKVESKISQLHSIQIITRLRSIDVGDHQVISIQGVDEYGNVFTSLEGMQFQWEIRQNDSIVSQISFSEASIQTTDLRIAMEKLNIQSDTIVIKGLKTGTVEIYARVKEEGYGVIEATVKMKVIEHFYLFPEQEIFILPTTEVQFDLALVKTEKNAIELEQIELPNQNYHWELNDTKKGDIQNNGIFTAQKLPADIQLTVSDTRIDDNILRNIIHIVEPQLIMLQIKEYEGDEWDQSLILPKYYTMQQDVQFTNNWNLVKDRQYYVRAFLYDFKRNPIQITQDIHIKFEHDNQIIEIIEQRNHELLIKAKQYINKSTLKASLDKIENKIVYEPKHKIETQQLLGIYSQVKIIRPGNFIHLPFISPTINQIFNLQTLGGSGGYEYKILNYTVGQIEPNGILIAKEIGSTVLEVYDLKNPRNKDQIGVEVTQVEEVKFPDYYKEIMVNSKEELFVIAQGVQVEQQQQQHSQYANCSSIEFVLTYNEKLLKGSYISQRKQVSKDINSNQKRSQYFIESLEKWRIGFNSNDYQEYIQNKEISQEALQAIFNDYQNYGICGEILLQSSDIPGQVNSKVRATNIDNTMTIINSEQITVKIYKQFGMISPRIESKEFKKGVEIILAYGSSFVWQLDGGPQYWEDKREMKISKETITPEQSASQIDLIIEEQETARFHQLEKQFYISCPPPTPSLQSLTTEQTFTFKLTMQNTPDILLHNTLNLSSEIKIACKVPKVVQISPLTVSSFPLDVNNAKVLTQQTLHLSNTEPHYFQVYAYDSMNQPFYNFSSLLIQWEIRPDTRLSLPNQQQQLQFLKLSKLTQEEFQQFPFHAQFKLLNYLDQLTKLNFLEEITNISPLAFLIHASTTTYEPIYTQIKFPEAWDQLPITAINPVSLTPVRQSLFFHGDNQAVVNVHHGSGNFEFFLNDSSIASFNYFQHNQSVVISPYKLGVLKLTAQDKLVQSTKTVSSLISICYASGIQLHAQLRIFQEQKSTELTVLLIDQNGRMIPQDQYQFVQFELLVKGLENDQRYFVFERGVNGRFIVNGFVPGEYLVYAVTPNLSGVESEWLKSNYLEIIVFPKLYSNPSQIVLSPECITNVALLGGPTEKQKNIFGIETTVMKHNEENYEIQQVKTEELHYKIKALQPNEVNQTFILTHTETNQILAEYQLKIKIGFVNEIEIYKMKNRNIYQGATFRLLALFFIKNQQLSPSICPFDIHWKSYQEQILSISVPDFKSAFERTKFLISDDISPVQYLIGTNASAIGIGSCELELKVNFNYQKFTKSTMTYLQTINILEPHQTQNTLFINKEQRLTSYLILPKNSQYQLNPNRPVNLERFSMECTNNLAAVSQTGLITTYNLEGRVSINLEDPNIKNDYSTVDLLITDIHSILIESSYKVISIPIGSESNLQIYALDSFGRVFPSGIRGIQYEAFIQDQQVIAGKISHFPICGEILNQECLDTSNLNNNNNNNKLRRPTLTLRGLSPGLSIVRITLQTDDNYQIFDQFTVIVGSIISPVSPVKVHLGAEVQFSAQVQKQLSSGENQELWFSNDERIVKINSRSGKMIAKEEGQTNVEYKDIVKYLTKVKVVKVDEIVINNAESKDKVLTNIQGSQYYKSEYKIAFKLLAKNQEINYLRSDESLPNINNNLKFTCSTNAQEWLTVSSEISSSSFRQIPYCIIKPKKSFPINSKIPDKLLIFAELESINNEVQYKFVQEFEWELFKWAFVPEKNIIQLNKQNPKMQFKVITTNELDIICLNDQIRTKLQPKFNENQHLLTLNIDLSKQQSDLKTKLQLRNPQTNQSEIIHIHYYLEGLTVPKENDQPNSAIDTILNILLLVIVIILCYSLYWFWESKRLQNYPNKGQFNHPKNNNLFQNQPQYNEFIKKQQ